MADKKALSNLNSRQKVTAGVVIVVILIILWQVYGLFSSGDSGPASAPAPVAANTPSIPAKAPEPQKPQTAADMPKPKADKMTPLEAELMRLQQETQLKYLTALNQLQMLKLERDIADNNKAIMAAKLDTVKTQKDIIRQLVPTGPTPTDYSQQLGQGAGAGPAQAMPNAAPMIQDVKYNVISVAQLRNKWSAVLAYQGNLYSVFVGDTLPPDGSKVISISNTGVVIEKDRQRKKISLVPII